MKWSLLIGRFFGVDLKVHVTFLLVVFLGASQWSAYGVPGLAYGVALVLLLFACVTLHEFGHAVVAQRFGIPVREIVLLPIGGVAVLARNPSKPIHELLIAAAGPAVNVVIAAVLWIALGVKMSLTGIDSGSVSAVVGGPPSIAGALTWLLGMNVALVLFNLIPAFPLDGGRILRGLLGFVMAWPRATRVAALTGQVIALGLGASALVSGNFVLGLIAVMIFFAAGSTNAEEQARTVLATWRAGDAYNRHVLTLAETDRLSVVTGLLLTGYQPDFAVLRGRALVGVVSRGAVLQALASRPDDPVVGDVMNPMCLKVDAGRSLDEVREQLQEADQSVAAVYDGRTFLGLVSLEDIAEANAILSSPSRHRPSVADARRVAEAGPTQGGVLAPAHPHAG